MKKGLVTIWGFIGSIKRTSVLHLAVLLCAIVVLLTGCQQSGETLDKGHRRHQRIMTLNQESLSGDIERAFLMDKPSKLTPMKLYPEIDD